MEHQKFWVVWSPEGGRAHVQHNVYEAAAKEQELLCAKYPGRKFHVLENVRDAVGRVNVETFAYPMELAGGVQ